MSESWPWVFRVGRNQKHARNHWNYMSIRWRTWDKLTSTLKHDTLVAIPFLDVGRRSLRQAINDVRCSKMIYDSVPKYDSDGEPRWGRTPAAGPVGLTAAHARFCFGVLSFVLFRYAFAGPRWLRLSVLGMSNKTARHRISWSSSSDDFCGLGTAGRLAQPPPQ